MKRFPLSLHAPAKINWFLKIVGKRDDGFHDIISLMQCVTLYDNLVFEHADDLEVISNSDIPAQDDIVYKAASLLKKYSSYSKGAKIAVKKNIPVSAGLGGGSSDAATALAGLNILWGLKLNRSELSSFAAEIGSDVPFFLNGPCALVEGRGEKVSAKKISSSVILLLVKPAISVSTAWAYTSYDAFQADMLTKKPFDIKLFCQALKRQDFTSLGRMLENDLEDIVAERYPVIREIKQKLLERGALISGMSGSGPTVFGVFDSQDIAENTIREMEPYWCSAVQTLSLS